MSDPLEIKNKSKFNALLVLNWNVIDSNLTVIDEVDTTNTPVVPVIDPTDFVADALLGCIVVD